MESFFENLFSRIRVRRLYLNIDPLWGTASDDMEVERVCRAYLSDIVVRRPEKASFGGAVKWLWAQPETEWFLHLEDDWLLLRPIDPRRLLREMETPNVVQISLSRMNRKAWKKGVWLDLFTTSPSFLRSSFSKLVSSLQNPELDPEKQMSGGSNPELVAAIREKFRHRLHGSRFSRRYIADIGRNWREARKIEKKIIDGRSVWIVSD